MLPVIRCATELASGAELVSGGAVEAEDRARVAALVEGARQGDQAAWDALVARYERMVWGIARGHRLDQAAAADVAGLTWLRVVEHLDRIAEPAAIGSWIATTARRECLAVLRRGQRVRPSDELVLDVADPTDEPVDARLLRDERDRSLWAAFERLDDRCRLLLRTLMADPQPSYREVSAALDMPVGSIGPTRMRCLRSLRDLAVDAGITDAAGTSGPVGGGGR